MRLEDAAERSESNVHVETHGRASHKNYVPFMGFHLEKSPSINNFAEIE